MLKVKQVLELWNDDGDTLVYLHSREDGRGPSFKLDSSSFASSRKLVLAAHGETQINEQRDSNDSHRMLLADNVQHLTINGTVSPPTSPYGLSNKSSSKGSRTASDYFEESFAKKDLNLYLPMQLQSEAANGQQQLTADDVETLVAIRNLFAFLAGQPLVVTSKQQSSLFKIFLRISDLMQDYGFTNLDGSTLGEAVVGNFARYVENFNFADVRSSREKTMEAIILGERMKSWDLYNEGFVHGVGKYEGIWKMKSPKFHLISEVTQKRMERAHLDLSLRLQSVRDRLDDFDFPSLFAGFANSSTSAESKFIRFKDWKSSYLSIRRHVIGMYKHRYGDWPPKARSKKNEFEESGLNRLLLQEVYQDFSDIYDMIVDRTSLTTRPMEAPSQDDQQEPQEPIARSLRRILDEYDHSNTPVQPPVPFDIPRIPSLSSTRRGFDTLDAKKQKRESTKKLRDDEINNALMQSYNRDSVKATPFLEDFIAYERRAFHGKSIEEISDMRCGQWVFIYAVLQSLPLLVVDAPGVKWTKGVEYLLCEVPRGSAPWIQERQSLKQSWYGIAGSSGLVSLPADVVEHGVDGIYHRSHCWTVAGKWAGYSEVADTPAQYSLPSHPVLPPIMPSAPGSRTLSQSPDRNASVALGLEQLPLPSGVQPSGARPASNHDPSKSFAAILGETNGAGKKKKR